jgi:protein-S-isoprenylcysteine O-methyltransferase Ste14
MARILGFFYGLVAYAVFFAAFVYLIGFLANFAVPKGIDQGELLPLPLALAIDLALIAAFGLQHSVMARPGFKRRIERWVPAAIERSTFVLAASAVLILLLWQWKPMTQVIWRVDDRAWANVLWGVYAAGFLLVLLSTFVIDHFDLFGLRQVTLNLLRRRYTHPAFRVTLFYRFVRHPLYVGFLLAFWGTPEMTLGRLVFAAGMTAYILIAVGFEERDLETFLGEDYRRYRERVPMFVPRLDRVHESVRPRADRATPSA